FSILRERIQECTYRQERREDENRGIANCTRNKPVLLCNAWCKLHRWHVCDDVQELCKVRCKREHCKRDFVAACIMPCTNKCRRCNLPHVHCKCNETSHKHPTPPM